MSNVMESSRVLYGQSKSLVSNLEHQVSVEFLLCFDPSALRGKVLSVVGEGAGLFRPIKELLAPSLLRVSLLWF